MARELTVILGVGPGLGQALARRFARGGHDVAMIARDKERLSDLAQEIAEETGRRVKGFSGDGTDLDGLRATMAEIASDMGPATVFIHSVSRWIDADLTELKSETLVAEMTLGAGAALAATQAVLPGMKEMGGGTVLWTGSRMGLHPEKNSAAPALTAAKAALRGLALSGGGALHDAGINFATITINGGIEEGTPLSPDRIADAFWDAHTAPREAWQTERIFEGGD